MMDFKVQKHEETFEHSAEDIATAQKTAQWMVEAEHFTPEQADENLKREGYIAGFAPQAPTFKTEVGSDINRMFPGARPEEYNLPPTVNHVNQYGPADQKVDIQRRNWMSAANLPREIGSTIASEIQTTTDSLAKMNQVQRDAWLDNQNKTLTAIWGDKQTEKIQLARQLVDQIEEKQPGLKKYLNETGAGHNATIIAMLHDHAVRMSLKK